MTIIFPVHGLRHAVRSRICSPPNLSRRGRHAGQPRVKPGHRRCGAQALDEADRAWFASQLDQQAARFDQKLDQQAARFDQKLDQQAARSKKQAARFDQKLDQQAARFDHKLDQKLAPLQGDIRRLQGEVRSQREDLARPKVAAAFGDTYALPYTVDSSKHLLKLSCTEDERDVTPSVKHKRLCAIHDAALDQVPDLLKLLAGQLAKLQHLPAPAQDVAAQAQFLRRQLGSVGAQNKALRRSLDQVLRAYTAHEKLDKGDERRHLIMERCDAYVIGCLEFAAGRKRLSKSIMASTTFAQLSLALPSDMLQIDCRGRVGTSKEFVTMEVAEIKMGRRHQIDGVLQLVRALSVLGQARQAWDKNSRRRVSVGRLIASRERPRSGLARLQERCDVQRKDLCGDDQLDIDIKVMLM